MNPSLKFICPKCQFATNDEKEYDAHFRAKFHMDAVK